MWRGKVLQTGSPYGAKLLHILVDNGIFCYGNDVDFVL